MPTLTVETGSGSASSNCYISLADANTYFSDRGIDAWASATTADREEAIIRGASYIESTYRGKWIGARANRDQALAWPRLAAINPTGSIAGALYDLDGWEILSNEVPAVLAHANAEAALAVINGTDLSPVLTRGGAIKRKSVQAGPVSTTTEYESGAGELDRLVSVEGLLRGLVTGGASSAIGALQIVRA